MKIFKLIALSTLLALLLAPAAVMAQEQAAPERGVIEFGFRGVTGEVYGRTDPGTVPFSNNFRPDLTNSALNLYTDNRSGFYIPKFNALLDNLFGSNSYLRIQSASNGFAFGEGGGTLTRDQSVLVTLGQYGKYKVQFRFDETPHLFTGTTRTLFTSNGAGGWNAPQNLFSKLCGTLTGAGACSSAPASGSVLINNALSGAAASAVPFTQQENRKAYTGSVSWNLSPNVRIFGLFSREHQTGTRPIGFIFAASSGGYVSETPETIDYYTNTASVGTEFGQKRWAGMIGYQGSFFQNNIPNMLVTNPFSDPSVFNFPTGTAITTVGPATSRMDLYPDNRYQQFVGQGAVEVGKHISLMASVTPGWIRQDANFQPLTTSTVSLTPPSSTFGTEPAYLPASNLNGQVDTLAMNYTAVLKARKNLTITAKYQHYDYNNNTPELLVRPVVGDTSLVNSSMFHGSTAGCYDPLSPASSVASIVSPSAGNSPAQYTFYCPGEQTGFNTKLFDIGGTWFFSKKSSMKFGYQRGWTDRTNSEVEETIEGTLYGALDMHLRKNLLLRVSGRHQNRMPQGGVAAYELDPGNAFARMPDLATRDRNRGDAVLQWDATQKLSLSAFWGTLQDNFNLRNSVNSLTPLGDASNTLLQIAGTTPTPIYGPYYAYGLLNSIGRNYGADADYALTKNVVLFAEYVREKNNSIIMQGKGGNPNPNPLTNTGCYPSCDPINDFMSATKDSVHSVLGGMDVKVSKRLDFSVYYNFSLAQSFLQSDGVNCQISNTPAGYCFSHFAEWNLESGSPARAWNATTGAVTTNGSLASPALTWSYPQNVNRIHEVGTIVKFKLTENLVPKFQYIFRQYANNDWQTGVMNPYCFSGTTNTCFGSSVPDVGNASALQKLLFLGADNPSYRAHMFTATLEYHF